MGFDAGVGIIYLTVRTAKRIELESGGFMFYKKILLAVGFSLASRSSEMEYH